MKSHSLSLEVEPDEREAYELFMEKRFGDSRSSESKKAAITGHGMGYDSRLDRHSSNRLSIHFSTMSRQEVK